MTNGAFLILDLVEDSVINETAQSIGEQILGNSQFTLQLTESVSPSEYAAEDENAPPVAYDVGCCRY